MSAERTVVHLVRHGQVENPHGVMYGRLAGYHLSEAGRKMAEAAAASFADHDIVAVFSSPLERAVETAEPIAEQFGLPVRTDDRLIESTNVFEGMTFGVGDGSLRRPAHWRHLRNPFRPSWGEPYVQVATRVIAAMADARDAARGHEAVCVSHQLPIWIARRYLEGRRLWHDPRRRECALASVTSVTYDGEQIAGIAYREPAGAAGRGQVGGA